jgi:NADPH:quinone reductase-like Zn-dependent oxidoreductase
MLKPRDSAYKARLAADIEAQVWPLIAKGAMKPLIYKTFPLEQAAEAQRLMESSEHLGKILLSISRP